MELHFGRVARVAHLMETKDPERYRTIWVGVAESWRSSCRYRAAKTRALLTVRHGFVRIAREFIAGG